MLCHHARVEAPPSAGVRVRSGAVRFSAAMAAITAYIFGDFLVWHLTSIDLHHGLGRWMWQLVPWLIGLPFLRRVSMAPSQWLVASLIPFGSFWLLGRLVDRSVALPARDWPPAWWEADRVIPLARPGFWTLAPEPAVAARLRLAPPARSTLKRRLQWWSRLTWPLSFTAAGIMALLGESVTAWFAIPTVLSLFLVFLGPELAFRAACKPRETSEQAVGHASTPTGV